MDKKRKTYLAVLSSVIVICATATAGSYFFTLTYHEGTVMSDFNGTVSSAVYDPHNGLVYVSSYYVNKLCVYNPENSSVVKTIDMPFAPSMGIYDPVYNLLYFPPLELSRYSSDVPITVINASTNTIAGNISLGNYNYVQNTVLDKSTGAIFVLANSGLFRIDGTNLTTLHLPMIFPAGGMYYAMDPNNNLSFFLDSNPVATYALENYSNSTSGVTQFHDLNPLSARGVYIEFIPHTNQLIFATTKAIYCVNPLNISDIQFSIATPQTRNGGSEVNSLVYMASTNSIYVSYGDHEILVYNDTSGELNGQITLKNGGLYPAFLSIGPNGTLLATAGGSLYIINPVLTNLQPYWISFLPILGMAISVSLYSIFRYLLWSRKTRRTVS